MEKRSTGKSPVNCVEIMVSFTVSPRRMISFVKRHVPIQDSICAPYMTPSKSPVRLRNPCKCSYTIFIQVPAGKRHHDGRSLSARAAEYASSKMFDDSFFRLSDNLFTIFSNMNYFSRTYYILHSSSRCSTISIRSSRNVPKSHRNRTCLRFWLAKRRESDSSLILKGNLPFR